MGLFGWSLPPGCSHLPGDDDPPCELCGLMPENCICPECRCGEVGNPACYLPAPDGCGMERTPEQITSLAKVQAQWDEQARSEAEFWRQHNAADIEDY